jgi:gliding motility-associated-like protein
MSAFLVQAEPVLNLNLISPTVVCSTGNDSVSYSVSGSGIPANTNIVIYQSTDSLFNPYLGQGDSIGYIPGNAIPQDTVNFGDCIKTLGIFIDACGASGQEGKNEYIILTSGNGIKVSNLAIDFSTQNNGGATNADINTGTSPCLYQTPTPSLITNLRVGSCNASNVIPASPTDSIPANAIILLFTSDNVTANYGIAGLCNLGYPIYVLQSACERTIGAFTNQSRCDAPSRYRTTVAIDKRQNCRDNFTYDLCDIFDEDGTYAIRQQGTDTASVANNGIRINAIDSCGGIDYTQLDFSADTILKFRISPNFCNDGFHYIKAITNPAGTQPVSNTIAYKLVCNDVSAISTTTTICSGESAIVNISSTDPNATLSWTVSGGTNITGASAGTGNTIQQVLINNGITKDSVTYTAISSDAGCTKTQTVKVVVNNKLNPRIVGNTSLCNGIGGGPLAIDGQFDSVRWSTGATTDTAYVGLAGLYIVTVYQNGCSATASVNVTNTITPTPDVRGNSEICNGNNAVLELFNLNAYDSIRWSNGTNGNQATFTSPGNYTLQAYLNGCITTLQFPIRNCDPQVCNPVITGNIPFCDGDSITLDAGSGFSSYSWNTGASSQTIKVKTGGKYVVSVTGQNDCTGSDSVQVVVNSIPQVSISGVTAFCVQSATRLTANADVDSLRWNTGETTNSISVDQAQAYSVTVYDNGCSNTASVQVTQLNLPASFSLGNDTTFCGNFSKVLSTGNQQTQWSTSVTAAQITVTEAGTYIATISNDCGSVSDTIVISKNELPFVNLGNDTAFCKGQLVLTAPTELRSYVWSTGEQSQSISVSEAGTYSVTVTDVNGCNGSDEIVISSNCSNELWIANAFTPNSDGVNDVFYIRGNPQNTTIERFIIYNRWGNKVFEATNILPDDATLGWNGTFKGEPAQFEVYGYEVVARFSDGQKKTLKGNVTLLK